MGLQSLWGAVALPLVLCVAVCVLSIPAQAQDQPTMTCRTSHCWRNREGGWSLKVDKSSVGKLSSDQLYKYGDFCADMKLPRGRTKGTVIAFYILDTTTKSNKDWSRSEVDTEIYGNEDSRSFGYTTNLFSQGQQHLEKYRLNFDAANNYNRYCMRWSRNFIVWSVNGNPYRMQRYEPGKPWPNRPSKVRFSFWDCSSYCGKQDYSNGGFELKIRNIRVRACPAKEGRQPGSWSACQSRRGTNGAPWNQPPGGRAVAAMRNIRRTAFKADYGWQRA